MKKSFFEQMGGKLAGGEYKTAVVQSPSSPDKTERSSANSEKKFRPITIQNAQKDGQGTKPWPSFAESIKV